jgi:hypothetical protein
MDTMIFQIEGVSVELFMSRADAIRASDVLTEQHGYNFNAVVATSLPATCQGFIYTHHFWLIQDSQTLAVYDAKGLVSNPPSVFCGPLH